MRAKILYSIISFTLLSSALLAQSHSSETGLQTDNDSYLFQGSDRYYTDGLFLFYRHALSTSNNPKLQNKVMGIEVGQKIFNPQTGNIPFAAGVDRPFAGYLYAGGSLNLLYKNESNLKLGAQVGIIGPASKGEQAQKIVHDVFGFYAINGWQYQIQNAFQLNFSAEYNRLLYRNEEGFDVTASGYANLGTGFNGAGVGPLFRLGRLGKLYNSISTQSTAIAKQNAEQNKGEFFVHYKPKFNYVAYDATIEGGLFSKQQPGSQEITRIPSRAVFTNQVGISYVTGRWIVDYTATFTSKVVNPQAYSQQWASVTVLYRFN